MANDPGWQAVHVELFVAEMLPGAQGEQAVAALRLPLLVPAAQSWHCKVVAFKKDPSAQGKEVVASALTWLPGGAVMHDGEPARDW